MSKNARMEEKKKEELVSMAKEMLSIAGGAKLFFSLTPEQLDRAFNKHFENQEEEE